jgi:glyoxylate/hydroxypyruvate reductase A
MTLLVITTSDRGTEFAEAARHHAAGLDVRLWPDVGNPADIHAALAWLPPKGVLAMLPNLKLMVSVGAGVDHLLSDPGLPDVPLVRYVDPDLTGRMAEYVGLQVLFHQRRMAEFIELQRQSRWEYLPEPAANEVRVGIMGLGVMGRAAIDVLRPFGFQLRGWSRTPKAIDGVACFAGTGDLDTFLAETDILVCLLPATPDTRGLLDARLLAGLSRTGRSARLPGPVLINAGRGSLQVEADILGALNEQTLYAASLDVFEVEPLPQASPLWRHPRVVVTPHNAAESTADAIARYFIRQVRDMAEGRPLENLVDRSRGY